MKKEDWIEQANKELAEDYKKHQPLYLIYGLRKDSHRGVELQDEIEEIVVYSEVDKKEEMKRKWKEVQVYKLVKV